MTEPTTLSGVLAAIVRHPWDMLGKRWNYKSAIFSSLARASVFFAANATAGAEAAVAAALTEGALRVATSGFYGALTQSFRRVEPRMAGTAAAMILLPALAHSLELVVHTAAGTPALARSIAASIAFTAFSTAFNLFAMRHNILIVGEGRGSILADLAAMPRIVSLFVTDVARTVARACL